VCGALVGQCTADDLAEIEAGNQPDISVVIDCAIAAIDAVDCLGSVTGCLRASGTTLSEECSSCFALQACCAMYQCSLLAGGPCHVGNPMSGNCVVCVEAMCRSHVNLCVGGQ
jgi:hypothetical protein